MAFYQLQVILDMTCYSNITELKDLRCNAVLKISGYSTWNEHNKNSLNNIAIIII